MRLTVRPGQLSDRTGWRTGIVVLAAIGIVGSGVAIAHNLHTRPTTVNRSANDIAVAPLGGAVAGAAAGSDQADNAQQQSGSQDDPYTRWKKLSPAEQQACTDDLVKCKLAEESRNFAFDNAAGVAGIDTNKLMLNDQADAARHCLWQLHLSTWYGVDYATKWGDAHEQNNDPAETHAMDLHNNVVARALTHDTVLQRLVSSVNGLPPADATAQEMLANRGTVDNRIVALCRGGIQRAAQVTYDPSIPGPFQDQLNPNPIDQFVFLTDNPNRH